MYIMNKKLTINNYLLFAISLLLLSACNNGGGKISASNQYQQSEIKTKFASASGANHLPIVDLMKLDYGLANTTAVSTQNSSTMKCASDNSVCASLNLLPSAQYAPTLYQDNAWIIPNANVTLTLNFNSDIGQDFHLSDIYNDIESNDLVGHIAQIDTTTCDQLVKKKGSSCQFGLAYSGDAMNERANIIHIIFKWDNGNKVLDYPFEVKNKNMTVENLPIVNLSSSKEPVEFMIRPQENSEGSGINFNYAIDNQISLKNVGTAQVPGFTDENPTIAVALSKQFSTGVNTLYYTNDLFTDCRNSPLSSGNSCLFRFYYLPEAGQNTVTPSGRFVFSYYQMESNGTHYNKVVYTQRFMMSIGDIKPQDYSINGFTGSIVLQKENVNNQGLSYSPILKNFKLIAKYEPNFDLAISRRDKTFIYGSGDFLGSDGRNYNGQQLAQMLHLDYDGNCFNSGFDPTYTNDLSYRSCKVNLKFDNLSPTAAFNKPLKLNLYASYDSQTDSSHVEEFVGTLNFSTLNLACNLKNALVGSYEIPAGTELHTNDCYFVTDSNFTKQFELLHDDSGEFAIYSCDGLRYSCYNKIWSSVGAIGSSSYTEFSPSGSIATLSPGIIHGGLICETVGCQSYYTAWISDLSPYDSSRKFMFNDNGTISIVKDGVVVWSTATSKGMIRDGNTFYPVTSQEIPW